MSQITEPFVVVNSSDRPFKGWVELTAPLPVTGDLSAYWRYKDDPNRLQIAAIGTPVGLDGRRAYVLMEEGAATELQCELVVEPTGDLPIVHPERARVRPEPVPLVRLQQRGSEEVGWSSDQTTIEGPLAIRRVVGRDGPFVVRQIAWRFADEPWSRFELSWLHSDPRNQALQAECGDVFAGHEDAYVHVYGPTAERLATKLEAGPFGWARMLWKGDVLGNGQGYPGCRGVLLQYLHARSDRQQDDLLSMEALQRGDVRACAARWEGAAGPFRAVPALSPFLGTGRQAALDRYQKWNREVRDVALVPWAVTSMGLRGNPGGTGTQEDFPIGPAPEILSPATVAPYGLAELEASGYGELRRPIHYREADGSRIAVENHPDWASWSQQTSANPNVSPDRLGKPPWFGPFERHGFEGRDPQHDSINRLGAAVLIGGSRLLQEEVGDQIVHWRRSGFDGANRARGRHMHAGAWLHRLTGDAGLLEAMRREVDRNVVSWPSSTAGQLGPAWKVDASSWGLPDGRVLGGRSPFWVGWAESLCAPGLWAGYRETGDDRLLELCKRSLRTLLLYGWFQRGGLEGWRIANGVVYLGFTWNPATSAWEPDGQQGTPLPPEAYADPLLVEDAGGGFDRWAYPSTKIAQALLPDEPIVQARCAEIIAQVKAGRTNTGTFDDLDRWMAL